MIVDREGDLVLTDEDNLLRLDVGGFLMLATGEEIEQRMPQRQALRYRQMDRAGFKLVPVGVDWDGTIKPISELDYIQAYQERSRVEFVKGLRYTLPLGVETSPLPAPTEPPQPDCCVGR